MTLPLKTLKSTRLRAASSAVFPRAVVVVVGKLSPSVTPVTVVMVAADVPMGKIMGYPGLAFSDLSPSESDTGLGDGVGNVGPPMD